MAFLTAADSGAARRTWTGAAEELSGSLVAGSCATAEGLRALWPCQGLTPVHLRARSHVEGTSPVMQDMEAFPLAVMTMALRLRGGSLIFLVWLTAGAELLPALHSHLHCCHRRLRRGRTAEVQGK